MGRSLRTEICAETPTKNDAAVTYWDDDGRYILWFPNNKVSNQTIVHETNHIVKLMMKYIGAQQENEGHAYTQDWLFKEIRRLLKL